MSSSLKHSPASITRTAYTDWVFHAEIISLSKGHPTFLAIQREVEEMCKLVVPEEWMDPNYRTHMNRRGAVDFRKDVVSAASADSFRGPDDRDSRAVLESFQRLLTLSSSARDKKRSNEATFRREIDNLLSDVFELQYLTDDDKNEFGKFAVMIQEGIWLKDNPVTTNEAHPDVLVVTAPFGTCKLQDELLRLDDQERSSTMPPPPVPSSLSPAMPTSTVDVTSRSKTKCVPALLLNIHYQKYDDSFEHSSISLIALPVEHKKPSKLHPDRQLWMDFTTAHFQRRALLLDDRTIFGLTLDEEGVSVYASQWCKLNPRLVAISVDPVHVFDLNNPPQVLQLFLFLRRLAKKFSVDFAVDREAIHTNATDIASNLLKGTTVWRTFRPSYASSGISHSRPPSTHGRPEKRQKLADASDGLTTDNLSGFNQDNSWDIESWAADVQPDDECAMSEKNSVQQEPYIDDEVVVPASEDVEAAI